MAWSTLILVLCVALGLTVSGVYVRHAKKETYVGAALVFAGCVVVVHLIPLLGFPWPLLSVREGAHGWRNILSMPVAWFIDVVEWVFAAAAFTLIVHRVRVISLVPLSFVAIVIVNVVIHVVVRLLGMNFYWALWK